MSLLHACSHVCHFRNIFKGKGKKKKKNGEAIPVTGHGAGGMENSHRKEGKRGEKKLEIMEESGGRGKDM
jgi:hypothetical protein